MSETISYLVDRGIPVMGHVGLMPQRINLRGIFSSQGHSSKDQKKFYQMQKYFQIWSFSIVLEAVKRKSWKQITKNVLVPTIGIGAGKFCDGQILVSDDMLGLFKTFTPKFVKSMLICMMILTKPLKTTNKRS